MALEATGPNAEQIRYWNELAGPKWVALEAMIDAQIAPLGRLVMERAALAPGEHVLDVGCGCGHTTLELARRVGPGGRVVGIGFCIDRRCTQVDRSGQSRDLRFARDATARDELLLHEQDRG